MHAKRPDLIIDVGMHRGEDAEFYLAKGFDVVAVEANPLLAAEARERFASEIGQGRLEIVEGAIAATSDPQTLALADCHSVWSTLDMDFVRRNQTVGATYRHVEVPGIRFEDVLDRVGIPHYLKIDIEGNDMLCVEALRHFDERPNFVSVESNVAVNNAPWAKVADELTQLSALGYRAFKYVDQTRNSGRRCPSPACEGRYVDATFNEDCSGLFGEETPGEWRTLAYATRQARLLSWHHRFAGFGGRWAKTPAAKAYRCARMLAGLHGGTWYDLHARLGG